MQIIYGYSNCTDKKYQEIFRESKVAVLQPDQKYHGLLIKGLEKNGATVRCLSGLPINRAVTKKKWIHEPDEQEDNVYYHYYRTINLPILRQMMIFFGALINVLKCKKVKDMVAICDCLNIANAYGFVLACRFRKIPVITIVTDLPDMLRGHNWIDRVNNILFGMMDGFVLLTEQMNGKVNHKKKPYIVLEGHVDVETQKISADQKWENESGKRVILYAGSITRLYGIANLVEGFIEANLSDAELWVYGDGDYRKELMELAKVHTNVIYKGVRPNQEIVECEMKAALLVNPRPTEPEYTKYSFPSKNMEYMVSGTPVLTTKLPGMPEEYYPFVYLLENETSTGIADKLKEIFSITKDERNSKGSQAAQFVLEHKSNIAQGKKIVDFMRRYSGRNEG